MNEKELQKMLYELLESNGFRCYSDKQHPSMNWFPKTFSGNAKKPDLIFFHNKLNYCDSTNNCKITALPSPIGIELKISTSFNEITKGIINQLDRRYKNLEYGISGENWRGSIPVLLFATNESIINGHIDQPHHDRSNRHLPTIDFVIERISWRLNMGILLKTRALTLKDLEEEGGEFRHRKLQGDFSKPNISISYDNNFIKLFEA